MCCLNYVRLHANKVIVFRLITHHYAFQTLNIAWVISDIAYIYTINQVVFNQILASPYF